MSFLTPDYSALPRVRAILTQVHARTGRAARAGGAPVEQVTGPDDELELVSYIKQATREIAVLTGRVDRVVQIVVDANTASVPFAWQFSGPTSMAIERSDGEGGYDEPVRLPIHDRTRHAGPPEEDTTPGETERAYIALGRLYLVPPPDVAARVTIVGTARTGMEADDGVSPTTAPLGLETAPASEPADEEVNALFPVELQEAVVQHVLARWYEPMNTAASQRHAARFAGEIDTFGGDPHAPRWVRLSPRFI